MRCSCAGINVGGINIKMADLKNALKSRPFSDVMTLLASGNVVLASELDPAGVKKEFEACLRETFGYDAWVVVLTADRVASPGGRRAPTRPTTRPPTRT